MAKDAGGHGSEGKYSVAATFSGAPSGRFGTHGQALAAKKKFEAAHPGREGAWKITSSDTQTYSPKRTVAASKPKMKHYSKYSVKK